MMTVVALAPAAAAQHVHSHAGAAADTAPEHGKASRTPESHERSHPAAHQMWMESLGGGWMVAGMAQAIPTLTGSKARGPGGTPRSWEPYLTQPAAMLDVLSPGSRLALRVTLNFEGLTQREGETSYGAWGEGFIDSRHPHTLLHEVMLSANVWSSPVGAFSLAAGKGFAPYGTDDPMSRPPIKYPTNHHLSQILERWTLNAQYLSRSGTSVEAGLFGGAEPTGPYDFGNISSFGDSWSVRLAQRFGGGFGPAAEWEASASYANVKQAGHDGGERTELANVALRHQRSYGFGQVYALAEASKSWPESAEGYYSLLGETSVGVGNGARHQPYYRIELATRPEYHREGMPGTDAFFRYHHDSPAIGATRWLVNTMGYAFDATDLPVSVRPYVELQHNDVRRERGAVGAHALYGGSSFWSVSLGMRLFLGGAEMRMGSYGLLDPMAAAMRPSRASR
jgi:hypothetical protein